MKWEGDDGKDRIVIDGSDVSVHSEGKRERCIRG